MKKFNFTFLITALVTAIIFVLAGAFVVGSANAPKSAALVSVKTNGTDVDESYATLSLDRKIAGGSDGILDAYEDVWAIYVYIGKIYVGKVERIVDFGAFVNILPGKDGLVHVSQISSERVEKVGDKLKEGDLVRVKVLEVDKQGRIRLSIKAVEEGPSCLLEPKSRSRKEDKFDTLEITEGEE